MDQKNNIENRNNFLVLMENNLKIFSEDIDKKKHKVK
jgi:hypothetical protein